MMKNFVKPILNLSLVAALAFGVTSCSSGPTPNANPTLTTEATASSTPTPVTSDRSTSSMPSSDPSSSSGVVNELQAAQKAFPDIQVVDGANKEDTQLAMFGAQRYINSIYNSGYLANGSWVKNGASSQELVKLFGKDWSDAYRAKLEKLIEDATNGTPDIKTQAAKDLMLNFFYFDNTGKITLPEDCSQNNFGAASCLVQGKLDGNTPMTYQVNKTTGAIYINAVFTANVRGIKDGIEGISPVQYNLQLEMIKNPYPDAKNFRYAYIVNDIGGSWHIDAWHKGE